MARHRKISNRQKKNAHGLAVMAFLGLAVVTAPVAGATDDTGSTGAATGSGSGAGATGGTGSSGQTGTASGSASGDTGSGDAAPSGESGSGGTSSDGTKDDGTKDDGTKDDADASDGSDDPTGSATAEPSTEPTSEPTSSASEPSETADPEPSSTAETTSPAQPEAADPTETPAASTTEPDATPSADAAPVAKTQEVVPAAAAVAKAMSLATIDDTSTASSLAIDPYGLPDNPFNTTDPTRQSLNPIGQFVEAITPAYPKITGVSDVAFAVTVVKFLNTVLGWTQSNGQDTIFSWPVYVLFAAAYQRLIDIGTNTVASVKVNGTSQTLGLVTVDLDVTNPDDTVYLPQLVGITGAGNTWVYEPITQTIVLTTVNPGMLLNGGDDTIQFTVDDSLGYLDHPIGAQSVTVDIPVHINPVITINGLPYFEIGAAQVTGTDADGKVHGTVIAIDPDGDAVTYTGSTLANTGSVEVDADGNWTYTPTAAAQHAAAALLGLKNDLVYITATDSKGGSSILPASVTVDITPKNTDPTLSLGTGPTLNLLRTSYTGTLNSGDADNDLLYFSASGLPVVGITANGGLVTVNPLNGDYSYTPAGTAWFNGGSDSFDITVDDLHGGTKTVTVVINGANSAPTFTTPATATITDSSTGTAKITAVAVDPEGGPVTYTAQADNGRGTVTLNADGSWTFVASDAARHVAATTGLISGLLAPKTETITVTATDETGASKTSSVTVDLVPLNTDPTLTLGDGPALNFLRTSYTGTVNGADADNDSLSYGGTTITSSGGTVVVLGNTYTYTPFGSAWFNGGSDSFNVTVDDGHGGTATVTVVIAGANQAPTVAAAATVTNPSTGTAKITAVASDPEGGPVTLSASVDPSLGSLTSNADGSWTFVASDAARHAAADTGLISGLFTPKSATITVTATDDKGVSKSASVSVDLVALNTNPTLTLGSGPALNALHTSFTGTVSGADADGDSLSYGGSTITSTGGTVLVLGNTYTYTPLGSAWFNGGSDSFNVTVDDGHGGTATVTVVINGANKAPTFTTPATATVTNTSTGTAKITAVATDPDGDPVTYTAQADNGRGTVTANADGSWTFVASDAARHAAADTGLISGLLAPKTETITITATDSYGASKTSSVTVNLVASNTNPTLTLGSGPALNALHTSYTGTVNGADADGDSLSYGGSTITSAGGTVVVLGNTYTYTPFGLAWFNGGSDSFNVNVDDGHGGTATVTVVINGANKAPTFTTPATATVTDSSTGTVKITAVATDPDGDPVTYTATADNGRGTVTANADGSWTFVASDAARHAVADTGLISGLLAPKTETITVTATDSRGASKTSSVTVDIVAKNALPAATVTTTITSTSPGDPETIKGKVVGSDTDGDSLSYASGILGFDTRSTAKGGSVTIYSDGTFTYTSDSGDTHAASLPTATAADKQDSFVVTITDGHGGSRDVTVNVNLDPYNRAPSASSSDSSTRDVNYVLFHTYSNSTTYHVTVNDADSDGITYTGVSATSKGTVSVVANTTLGDSILGLKGFDVTYTSNTNNKPNPTETFTVSFSDGHGGTTSQTLTY